MSKMGERFLIPPPGRAHGKAVTCIGNPSSAQKPVREFSALKGVWMRSPYLKAFSSARLHNRCRAKGKCVAKA
eukprot:527791-Pelagomonas_calceolata.AAC.7